MPSYWLLKSEPDLFGLDHLRASPDQTAPWDGVRNYQARNFLRDQVKLGDLAFFYHSRTQAPAIVGICEVVREAYTDPIQYLPTSPYYDPKSDPAKPRWMAVDVRFVRQLARPVTLAQLKAEPTLAGMRVVMPGMRLSVQPVAAEHWATVLRLAGE